jgi:hypothetical protein
VWTSAGCCPHPPQRVHSLVHIGSGERSARPQSIPAHPQHCPPLVWKRPRPCHPPTGLIHNLPHLSTELSTGMGESGTFALPTSRMRTGRVLPGVLHNPASCPHFSGGYPRLSSGRFIRSPAPRIVRHSRFSRHARGAGRRPHGLWISRRNVDNSHHDGPAVVGLAHAAINGRRTVTAHERPHLA